MERGPETNPTVTIVVDSTASLQDDHILGLPIEIVPVQVTVGGRSYLDGVDLDPNEFYRQIRDESVPAQTAAPSPASFQAAFERAFELGRDVLCITTTAKMSATNSIAVTSLEEMLESHPERRGIVLDSATAGGAQALVALAAARLAVEGGTLDEVERCASSVVERVYFLGILESLKRLQRSGRAPRVAQWATSLLNIKPVLGIWPGEGEVRMLARPRTKARAVERMLGIMAEETQGKPVRVVVMHAAVPDEAAEIQRAIVERFQCVETILATFTPVIGAHTGPGLVGVAFHVED